MRYFRAIWYFIFGAYFTISVIAYVDLAYMKFIYQPPPPVPCSQEMTLQPGQSCFFYPSHLGKTEPPK